MSVGHWIMLAETASSAQTVSYTHLDVYKRQHEEWPQRRRTVAQGRYIGVSAMWVWQFQKAQHIAERHGWTTFVSMQPLYNLVYREEKREMVPL